MAIYPEVRDYVCFNFLKHGFISGWIKMCLRWGSFHHLKHTICHTIYELCFKYLKCEWSVLDLVYKKEVTPF